MSEDVSETSWPALQEQLADIPGERGKALRCRHYAPFFLRFGRDVIIEEGCRFYAPGHIVLEDDVRINVGGLFYGSGGIFIGRHVRIGPRAFIHSANHDIAPNDPRAFFERSYNYRPVIIGDNVLVSANVSVLPGVHLGSGSFVAGGAVVPEGRYLPGARLFGTPARNRPVDPSGLAAVFDKVVEVPEIAFVTPADRPDLADAVDLLRETLGLPQVTHLVAGAALPASVHTLVQLGDAAASGGGTVVTWRLAPGEVSRFSGGDEALSVALPGGEMVGLPTRRDLLHREVANADAPVEQRLRVAAYWLNSRLFKRGERLSVTELREWLVALHLLNWDLGHAPLARALQCLWSRWPTEYERPKSSFPISDPVGTVWAWLSGLAPVSARRKWHEGLLGWIGRKRPEVQVPDNGSSRLTRKEGLANPVEVVWLAVLAGNDPAERTALCKLLQDMAPHCNTSLRLVALGLAAHLLDAPDLLGLARNALRQADRWPAHGVFPLQRADRKHLLLSPLFLAWLFLVDAEGAPVPPDLFEPRITRERLPWRGFESGNLQWRCREGEVLVDENNRRISEDLLTNWLLLQVAPCSADKHLELGLANYDPTVEALEAVWLALLIRLQHLQGRPLIRLRPWPAPYKAALSLRYDVDRPITIGRVSELIRLQAERANAAMGSWYFRDGDGAAPRIVPVLHQSFQEVGAHIENVSEVTENAGVTHHSAPTSFYWQGDVTTRELEERKAYYGEFHAAALPTPRRAWLAASGTSDGLGRLGGVTVTPLHFPLEGGTNDHGLGYFDRALKAFRSRIGAGGHAIVGSHPDLDQAPMVELLERENLTEVWKAPVRAVVERWRQVMTPGNIRLVSDSEGILHLAAVENVTDLTVEMVAPEGSKLIILQLMQHVPRPVLGDGGILRSNELEGRL